MTTKTVSTRHPMNTRADTISSQTLIIATYTRTMQSCGFHDFKKRSTHFRHHYIIWRINCENGNFGSSFSQMSKFRTHQHLLAVLEQCAMCCVRLCCVMFESHAIRSDFITYFTVLPSYLLSFPATLVYYASNFFFYWLNLSYYIVMMINFPHYIQLQCRASMPV